MTLGRTALGAAHERELVDFFDAATVALHRVGADGTISWANRAALELLGYAEDEYLDRPVGFFHVDPDVARAMVSRLARGEVIHEYEARLRAKNGSIKVVLVSPHGRYEAGKLVDALCIMTEVPALRATGEEGPGDSERLLELVMEALPVLVSFVGADERYRLVSRAYEQWFGKPKQAILGKHLAEVLGQDAYRAIKPNVDRALSGTTVRYDAQVPYSAGGTRFIEATYVPQFDSSGGVIGFVSLVADSTERRSFERFRADAAARADRLLKVTGAIADAVSSDEVYAALVDHVAEAVDASSAGLWLVDDEQRTARLVRARGYTEAVMQAFQTVPIDAQPSIPVLDAVRRGEPIFIPSQAALLERYPHVRAATTAGRSYRISCLPLVVHGRVLGGLGLTIEEAREANEEERDFLLLIAEYANQAVERLRLLEAERRSRAEADAAAARLGFLSSASRAFADSELDLDARLRRVVSELGTAFGSGIGLALLQRDGLLHTVALHHPVAEAQEMLQKIAVAAPLHLGEGMTGRVAESGKSALLPSIDPEELAASSPPAFRDFLHRFPVHAMICTPLRAEGRVIGTVSATRNREGETYTTEDLHLLEELSERAAVAIENSRLFRESLEARSRAEQLYRFAQAVMVADQVESVFDAALAAIETALGAKRSAILTFDAGGVMRFRAFRNLSDAYRAAVEGHSPWPRDATSPSVVLVTDALNDPSMTAYASLFRSEKIGALAFIPLVTRGRLIGKFMVYHDEPHAFSSHEIETATAIANHLASVITRFAVVATLEETIRYNELFAGALAHDLRNPLGAIMTAAQVVLMQYEGEANGSIKSLARIVSSGRRMKTMIDQLLDLTRARTGGGIPVAPQEANLAELCELAVDELELTHPEWKIRRAIHGDQHGAWDSTRLLQVISNLVANAGQHGTAGGEILVTLDGREREHVSIAVKNQGEIPEALLPHIFDPFRSTRYRSDLSRGLGLGLFIVREIVRAHGGTVEVVSSEASGTTFSVHLPRWCYGRRASADDPRR